MRQQRTSPAPAAVSFPHPAHRRARRHSRDTPGLTRGRGPAGCPRPWQAGARSYGAAPARSASLRVMAAVPGSGGSRTTTAGTNSGCAACNPYPTPSCALRRRVPPGRHHPLHATTAALSVPPLLPLCAIAGLTTGRCLYVRRRPCPWPSCTRHAQPGPLGVHIAVARVSPTSTPLTRAHAPPLCAPRVSAPSLAPSTAMPHVSAPIACALASLAPSAAMPRILAPIACALASRAPSAAVPHVSAPVGCTLTSWAPSAAMRCDHVTVFTSRSCATGWHTRIGRAWETVHTL